MTEDSGEAEVQRVAEAISALEAIPDAEDRFRLLTKALHELPGHQRQMREMRQQAAILLQGRGMTLKEIGDIIGVKPQAVYDIINGRNGASQRRAARTRDGGSAGD